MKTIDELYVEEWVEKNHGGQERHFFVGDGKGSSEVYLLGVNPQLLDEAEIEAILWIAKRAYYESQVAKEEPNG